MKDQPRAKDRRNDHAGGGNPKITVTVQDNDGQILQVSEFATLSAVYLQPLAVSRDLVAACLRGWASQIGGDIKMNLGYSISATMGGGMVFNALQPRDLPGLFLGAQAGINGARLGISADALRGFNLHDLEFTNAFEVDGGGSLGLLGVSAGRGVQLGGVFFIPINVPYWYNYI